MSASLGDATARAEASEVPPAVVGTRVDAAHSLGDSRQAETEDAAEPSSSGAASDVQFALRNQAEQLAALLRAKQEDLDRRESLANAQAAQLEKEQRSARLWFDERRQELTLREEELANREREIEDRSSQLAAAEEFHEASRQEAETDVNAREEELLLRQSMIDSSAKGLVQQETAFLRAQEELQTRVQEIDAREAVLHAEAERLAAKERCIETSERLLAEGHAELVALRGGLDRERERLDAQAKTDRQRLAEQQRRQQAELIKKKESLGRRGEQLDHRRTALKQLRSDLMVLHRETLELRFAAEELFAQLSGSLAPATLSRSLATIRSRLTEHYRLEAGQVAEERQELETLRAELTCQHEKLRSQRLEMQGWLVSRQEDIEKQAARLTARELELDRQEAHFRELEGRWSEERFGLQQELRRLHGIKLEEPIAA